LQKLYEKRLIKSLIQKYAVRGKVYVNDESYFQVFRIAKDCSDLFIYLSNSERKRAMQISHQERRNAYIVAHALCRIFLILETNTIRFVSQADFKYTTNGKPFISGHIYFNISYANELCVIGISSATPIGVDIVYREAEVIDRLPLEYLHPQERHIIQTKNTDEIYEVFLEMWAYKESVSKALGLGVAMDFATINSNVNPLQYQENRIFTIKRSFEWDHAKYIICFSYIDHLSKC